MDVVLVRWPAEEERRQRLLGEQTPVLLLVEAAAEPPVVDACLEDWVRIPAPDADVRARVAALQSRARAHLVDLPVLDAFGVLRFGDGWVPLPPVEARLTAALLDRFGAVVSRDALARAGWPDGAPGRNALDVHVLRLRRRLDTVRLAIRTVRSRGYLLEAGPAGQQGQQGQA